MSVAALAVVGLAVALMAWSELRPNWEQRSIVAVEGAVNGHMLDVTVVHEDCGTGDPRVLVDESDPDVVLLTAEYNAGGNCDDVGLSTGVIVELREPLGEREVLINGAGPEVQCNIEGAEIARCANTDSD